MLLDSNTAGTGLFDPNSCHQLAKRADGAVAMAYAGQKPWHDLGADLSYGASVEVWQKEAGLDFEVFAAVPQYIVNGQNYTIDDRKVLFRSDTMAPLGIVGKGYKVYQPGDALEYIRQKVEAMGYTIETAGAMNGGKRIWVLAKVNEGADVVRTDRVLPYLLVATSFDGGMATTFKLTCIRVVCNNTITAALNALTASNNVVKVHHGADVEHDEVDKSLGLNEKAWSQWLTAAKRLAEVEVEESWLDKLLLPIAAKTVKAGADEAALRDSKAYKQVLGLFNGSAIGSDLTGGNTLWQFVNSVTEYVDHHKGRAADSRMRRAWFGDGDKIKTLAMESALALIA